MQECLSSFFCSQDNFASSDPRPGKRLTREGKEAFFKKIKELERTLNVPQKIIL